VKTPTAAEVESRARRTKPTAAAVRASAGPDRVSPDAVPALQAQVDRSPRMGAQRATLQRVGAGAADPPADSGDLPGGLRASMEAASGVDLSGVRVHRQSSEPHEVGASAFAAGDEIHLAPGQDRHLPHEAWHVVQQRQGRVAPTRTLENGVRINDDPALEREADEMGARAEASRDVRPAEVRGSGAPAAGEPG